MHRIIVGQSEAARRAALLVGQPATAEVAHEVPADHIRELLALPWTRVEADGTAICRVPIAADTPVPDLAAAMAFAQAIVARQAADRDAVARSEQAHAAAQRERAQRWAALPLEWRVTAGVVCYCRPSRSDPDYAGPLAPSGIVVADREAVRRYVPEALAEAEAEAARQRAEREAAAEAERAAHLAQLRAWAEAHGSKRVRLLLEEQHPAWPTIAEDEFLAAATPPAWSTRYRDARSHAHVVRDRTRPEYDDLRALRLARKVVAERRGQWPDGTYDEPRMVWVVEYYRPTDEDVPRDADGDAVADKYAAIALVVRTPTGRSQEVYAAPADVIGRYAQ